MTPKDLCPNCDRPKATEEELDASIVENVAFKDLPTDKCFNTFDCADHRVDWRDRFLKIRGKVAEAKVVAYGSSRLRGHPVQGCFCLDCCLYKLLTESI